MIWKLIYSFLKKKGVNIYSPGTHIGECKQKYVVLKKSGSTSHSKFSTDVDIYTLLIYVPENKYSELDEYIQEIKGIMKELYPLVKPHGLETGSYHDIDKKAHTVSVDYRNYKKS